MAMISPAPAVPGKNYSTLTDRKDRYGGIFEIPVISRVVRLLVDGGRVRGLAKGLKGYDYASVLDVGCGIGECSAVSRGRYVGIDNCLSHIEDAVRNYKKCHFLVGDAMRLPFRPKAFDLCLLIDTSHHLPDDVFKHVLVELRGMSRKYIVVSDPIVTENQGRISAFFYSLDRGACFRKAAPLREIFNAVPGIRLKDSFSYRTFPGLYVHHAWILEVL